MDSDDRLELWSPPLGVLERSSSCMDESAACGMGVRKAADCRVSGSGRSELGGELTDRNRLGVKGDAMLEPLDTRRTAGLPITTRASTGADEAVERIA